jgi:hypothetical protein
MSGEGKRVGMQSGVGSAPFLDSTEEGFLKSFLFDTRTA